MAIFAYMLAVVHIILLPAALRERTQKIRLRISTGMVLVAVLYLTLAAYRPEFLPLLIVAEIVAVIRFMFHDSRLYIGIGSARLVNRHTEQVFLKSIKASIFTTFLTAFLLALCIQTTWAVQVLVACPLFLLVEYFFRRRQAQRVKRNNHAFI